MAKGRRRDRNQALLETRLKFNPERSSLGLILNDLALEAKAGERSAIQGSKMMARSIAKARPQVDKIYQGAIDRSKGALATVNADLAKLGPGGDALKGAIAIEGAEPARLATTLAQAQKDLRDRQSGAIASGIQEASNIRANYQAERGKVIERLLANEREAGDFVQARYAQLRGERADRNVTIRGQNRTQANADREFNYKTNKDKGLDPQGNPLPTKPKTPKPRSEADRARDHKKVERIETASQLYKQATKTPFPQDHPKHGQPVRPEDIYGQLVGTGEGKFSKTEIDLARDLARNGGRLSQRGMKVARSHGIRVPKAWRPQKPSGYSKGQGRPD